MSKYPGLGMGRVPGYLRPKEATKAALMRRSRIVEDYKMANRRKVSNHNARYKFVSKDNPRYEGTRAHKVVGAALRAVGTRPFTLETVKKAGYTSTDLRWDIEHGHVKKVAG